VQAQQSVLIYVFHGAAARRATWQASEAQRNEQQQVSEQVTL
jgi:hypothetical protein